MHRHTRAGVARGWQSMLTDIHPRLPGHSQPRGSDTFLEVCRDQGAHESLYNAKVFLRKKKKPRVSFKSH